MRNYVSLVVYGEAGMKGWGREIQQRDKFFYMDDGLIASTHPEWLQGAFDVLTGMFNWVGLKTNIWNTIGIICHPCRAVRKNRTRHTREE